VQAMIFFCYVPMKTHRCRNYVISGARLRKELTFPRIHGAVRTGPAVAAHGGRAPQPSLMHHDAGPKADGLKMAPVEVHTTGDRVFNGSLD